jgi:citrate synthase
MFTVLFAIPRVSGWLAQWQEMLLDPEQKISRPRQIYTGNELRKIGEGQPAPAELTTKSR